MWFGFQKPFVGSSVASQRTTASETDFMKASQFSQVINETTRVINGASTIARDLFITSNFIFGVRKVSFHI